MVDITPGKALPIADDFHDMEIARAFWRVSYRGGRKYRTARDADGEPVLVPHEAEDQADYKRRRRLTAPPEYVGPIIRRYNDFVMRAEPQLPEGIGDQSLYARMWQDADGKGTSALTMLKRELRHAQIDGSAYLLIDSTKPADAGPMTLADERANGYRLILRPISASAVVYYDEAGAEAIVIMRDGDGRFARHITAISVQDYGLKEDSYTVESQRGPARANAMGILNLVRLIPEFEGESESQVSALAEIQKAVFNYDSLLNQELYDQTFTRWMVSGVEPDEAIGGSVKHGSNRIFGVSSPSASAIRMSADISQADSIRRSIAECEARIYRAAGVDAGSPTQAGAPESGVAKAFRFNDLNANLAAMGDAVERAWNRCMMIAHMVSGEMYPGDAKWPDDHAPSDYGDELRELIDAMTSTLPSVIKRKAANRFVDRNFQLSDDEKAELADELDSFGIPPMDRLTESGRSAYAS